MATSPAQCSSVRLFCHEYFKINELKAEWHFNNLLELHYPTSRCYIFAVWACGLCSQSTVAFAITRFITFQRLRFYNLLAYRDLVFLTLLPRQENRLFSVSWGSICVKTQSHFLAFRSLRRRWRLQWSGGFPRGFPTSGKFPRSQVHN